MLKSLMYSAPIVACSAVYASFTDTPSATAFSRSRSTRSCGDVGRKKVFCCARRSSFCRAAMKSVITFCRSAGLAADVRSCTYTS